MTQLTLQDKGLQLPSFNPEKHARAWQDMMGQWYSAGDIVAVATTYGQSARQSIALVKRINTIDSYGKPHQTRVAKVAGYRDAQGLWVHPVYEYTPYCSVTIRRILDATAWNKYYRTYTQTGVRVNNAQDSTLGPEKVIKLELTLADVLAVANA